MGGVCALPRGNAVFERIGDLLMQEFQRKTFLEIAHDPGWHPVGGIRVATTPERVEELARMLGGVEITAKAREHAQDMLQT